MAFDVKAVNDIPVAQPQTVTLNEDASLSVVLSATDIDNTTLTYSITQNPSNGVLSGTGPNLIYTPNNNFNGSDSFGFIANDGLVASAITTVLITVTAANDAPVAIAQTIVTSEDTPTSIVVSGSDIDGDILTYSVATQPLNGVLSGIATNLTYTPNANYRRDKPGKSPMGMDLVPFYKDDGGEDGVVKISPIVQNNLGVRITSVKKGQLDREISTVGYINFDEEKLYHLHTRVEGWVEKLEVKATGDVVKKGQKLFELYSPTLVNAQEEYVSALKSKNRILIKASKDRLIT